MISVPSLLPPLSGNSPVLSKAFMLSLLIILSSCGGTKKTMDNAKVMRPSKREAIPRNTTRTTNEVDTINWTEIDRTREYEESIEDLEMDKRDSYTVALLYPFAIEKNQVSDATNSKTKLGRISDYYAGTLMALDQLDSEDMNLRVNVFDSESGNFDLKLKECRTADVIIGPKDRGQLATTAQYGKNNEIPVVSPWLSSSKVTKENPYYIQLKPSLKKHMSKMVEHVKANFSDQQVFLLGRNRKKDKSMMGYVQKVAAAINRSGDKKTFREFYIEEDSLISGDVAYDSIFYEDKTSVFILPNWSFVNDEQFVYNAVRKMSGEKGLNDVVLYGMPILLESEKIKFEHYANLRMRIVRSSYLDRAAPEVEDFRKAYYNKYQGFPSEEAYKGYDMMMFVGRNLKDYGKKFQYFLDTYESGLYQTTYDIQKVFSKSSGDKFDKIEYFQNNHLNILEFENNKFNIN